MRAVTRSSKRARARQSEDFAERDAPHVLALIQRNLTCLPTYLPSEFDTSLFSLSLICKEKEEEALRSRRRRV